MHAIVVIKRKENFHEVGPNGYFPMGLHAKNPIGKFPMILNPTNQTISIGKFS